MLHTRFTTPAGPVPVAAASAPDAVPFAPAGVGSVGGGRRGRSARDVVDLDGLSWSATGWFGCPVPADGATAMAVSERFRADGACWQACLVPLGRSGHATAPLAPLAGLCSRPGSTTDAAAAEAAGVSTATNRRHCQGPNISSNRPQSASLAVLN